MIDMGNVCPRTDATETIYSNGNPGSSTPHDENPREITSVLVLTDVGQEIDDELALYHLLRQPGLELTVVFLGSGDSSCGKSPEACMNLWYSDFEPFCILNASTTVEYTTIDAFLSTGGTFDFVLQIGPMHNRWDGHNLTVREKYIFAGNYHTQRAGGAPSFNIAGSEAILSRFSHLLLEIDSPHMAQMRPTREILNWLPDEFVEKVAFTGFKLAFGRMPVNLGKDGSISKRFSEGLVTNDARVGRGANYNAVDQFYSAKTGMHLNDIPAEQCTAKEIGLARLYFDSIGGELKDPENSVLCLSRMNHALATLIPGIWDTRDSVLYSTWPDSDFDGHSQVREAFLEFKAGLHTMCKALSPVYDLYASYVLIQCIAGVTNAHNTPRDVFVTSIVKQ